MARITERFPFCPSFNTSFDIVTSVTVAQAASGRTERNRHWKNTLQAFSVNLENRDHDDHERLIDFWQVVDGPGTLFPMKNYRDFKSCALSDLPSDTDQSLGTATAGQTDFQLIKTSTVGVYQRSRPIERPISGTVVGAVNGTPVIESVDYTVDYLTGIVTFLSPMAGGENVTFGFEYDLWCAFVTKRISIMLHNKSNRLFIGNSTLEIVEAREDD